MYRRFSGFSGIGGAGWGVGGARNKTTPVGPVTWTPKYHMIWGDLGWGGGWPVLGRLLK